LLEVDIFFEETHIQCESDRGRGTCTAVEDSKANPLLLGYQIYQFLRQL
jgi:hypothetical protein